MYFYRFSDLLALADDIEADFKSVRVLRGVPARKAANASAAMGLDNRNSRKTTKKIIQETSGSSDSSDVSKPHIICLLPKHVGLKFRNVHNMNYWQAIVNYWFRCCTGLDIQLNFYMCIANIDISNTRDVLERVSNPNNCFSMYMYFYTSISEIFE